MNQRITNKIIKKNYMLPIIWMYHFISDAHIEGHSWLHDYQFKQISKYRLKFKQIRKSKYNNKRRIELCCPFIKSNNQ